MRYLGCLYTMHFGKKVVFYKSWQNMWVPLFVFILSFMFIFMQITNSCMYIYRMTRIKEMNSLNLDIHHDSISTSIPQKKSPFTRLKVWHYQLWSFKTRNTKLEKKMHKNQHTQSKLLSIGLMGSLSSLQKIRVLKLL